MPKLEIEQFPCLSDNYAVLLHDAEAGVTASIDAPDADQILKHLDAKGWRLTHLLITHHHKDHTGGNLRLKEATGCTVIGPLTEADRVPGIDRGVREGDTIAFGGFEVRVLETPGHTLGHVSYWIPSAKVAFVGDTLFAMGAGRVFEGNAEMMWNSLKKIMGLPRDTEIYCGHEYTAANARFALTVDPDNAALRKRAQEVERQRANGEPTLPTRLDKELETNPFLRTGNAAIRQKIGLPFAPDWKVFAEIRERKNKA
jgi:hydroxyacylglutathione hydrolase